MKRKIFASLSAVISIAFASGFCYIVSRIVKSSSRNFGVAFALPLFISLIVYAYISIILFINKATITNITVSTSIAAIQAFLPVLSLFILGIPELLFGFTDPLTIALLYGPIVLLILPIVILIDVKKQKEKSL